jgi:IS605 OrfB family transposase
MAKRNKSPYRKCQTDTCLSYVMAKTEVEYTASGIPFGLTVEGQEYMTKNRKRCGELRHAIICEGLQRKSLDNPERLEDFIRDVKGNYKLPSRLYNAAIVDARGQIASVLACHELDVETKRAKLERAVRKLLDFYAKPKGWKGWSVEENQAFLERKVACAQSRYTKTVRKGLSYFPGRKIYERQHLMDKKEFREKFEKHRTGRLTCYGVAGERDGNSELNARFAFVTKGGKYVFDIVKNGAKPVVLWKIKVGKKEGKRLMLRLIEQQEGAKVPISVSIFPTEKHDFETRVGWSEPQKKPYAVGEVFLGVDTNGDNLKWVLFRLRGGKIHVLEHGTLSWNPRQRANIRDNQFHIDLNELVALAMSHQAVIVLEYLDFEGGKQMENALGRLLHTIPYVKIRDMLARKCNQEGVPMRVVNCQYTSLLGNLLADMLPGLDRDQLSAVPIGLKASTEGVQYLESLSEKLLAQNEFTLRLNIKGKVGCHVRVQKTTSSAGGSASGATGDKDPSVSKRATTDKRGFLESTGWMCELVGSLSETIGGIVYLSKGKEQPPKVWHYTHGAPLRLAPLKPSRVSSAAELVPKGNVQHCPVTI